MTSIDLDDLRSFLVWCGREGYAASPTESIEADGSHTIILKKDGWKFHDNFFGGEPFGGREVVFSNEKAVWMMVYYGVVAPSVKDLKPVYGFLKSALKQIPAEAPFRGPKEFSDASFRYENTWEGDIARFHGVEHIFNDGERVYSCRYIGGLVDTA